MKGIESVCFQIISYTGAAKSCFVEAINEAEQGNFERAEELLCEGDQNFNEGHHAHQNVSSGYESTGSCKDW